MSGRTRWTGSPAAMRGARPAGPPRAPGAGLWFHFRIRATPLGASAVRARGEHGTLHLRLGAPF